MGNQIKERNFYWDLGFRTVKDLETDNGILASGRSEVYGCIFGRDSLITDLKLLRVYEKTGIEDFLALVKKSLSNLMALQGNSINIESGEQPGKCIHEYRPTKHEHLTRDLSPPWYVYPDGQMRIYDSVDSTPLLLVAAYRYWHASDDDKFVDQFSGNIEKALLWLSVYGDGNSDGFVDYELHPGRSHGGLVTQSWMDSIESVFHEDGSSVVYPIAPVEVQAYVYLALTLWSRYFGVKGNTQRSASLKDAAEALKKRFNDKFIIYDDQGAYLAAGIDGSGAPLTSVRSSMGHVLWASDRSDGALDSILDPKHAQSVVKRLVSNDIFDPVAGVRTLSKNSACFDGNSYHNGSIWPHDNGMVSEGLENFGYIKEASMVREAVLEAISHFKTPIELYAFNKGKYSEWHGSNGQTGCKQQAWSAAAILDMAITRPTSHKKPE